MSNEIVDPAIRRMLNDLLDAFLHRHERRAARAAGSLTFWRDGMLRHLQLIADGKATKATFTALKKEFDETSEPVARSIAHLRRIREALSVGLIAKQIDVILNDNRFGKNTVRQNIEQIIKHHKVQDVSTTAQWICDAIHTLNAEIERLHRLVNSS